MIAIDQLTKAELCALIPRATRFVDQKDIAGARWDAAEAEATRLSKLASAASDRVIAMGTGRARSSGKQLLEIRRAQLEAEKAHQACERARRRADRRWKELQAHFMKDAK
jgi:hypothetical protein